MCSHCGGDRPYANCILYHPNCIIHRESSALCYRWGKIRYFFFKFENKCPPLLLINKFSNNANKSEPSLTRTKWSFPSTPTLKSTTRPCARTSSSSKTTLKRADSNPSKWPTPPPSNHSHKNKFCEGLGLFSTLHVCKFLNYIPRPKSFSSWYRHEVAEEVKLLYQGKDSGLTFMVNLRRWKSIYFLNYHIGSAEIFRLVLIVQYWPCTDRCIYPNKHFSTNAILGW